MQQAETSPPIEADALKADRKAPHRRCIVTRESKDKEQLIRFVIAPDGALTPDVAGKLPGRGYWVTAQSDILHKALKDNSFKKVAKASLTVSPDLCDKVSALLQQRALQALALANKAGQLVAGFEKVDAALSDNKVIALIHAQNASPESVKKLPIRANRRFCCFPVEALSGRLGLEHAVHLALLEGAAAQSALKEIRRFTGFLQTRAV